MCKMEKASKTFFLILLFSGCRQEPEELKVVVTKIVKESYGPSFSEFEPEKTENAPPSFLGTEWPYIQSLIEAKCGMIPWVMPDDPSKPFILSHNIFYDVSEEDSSEDDKVENPEPPKRRSTKDYIQSLRIFPY